MPEKPHASYLPFVRALLPWAAWVFLSLAGGLVLSQGLPHPDAFLWGTGVTAVSLLFFRWVMDAYRLQKLLELLYRHHMLPATLARPKSVWPWGPALGLKTVHRAVVQEYLKAVKKARETAAALERFVGASAADQGLRKSSKPSTGGETKKVFCLFADVRGFTQMTERLRPDETVEILNRIFTALEEIITQYGGEINKYIGDAVFAYFRCPYENEDVAARNVLRAALRIQEAFDALNVKLRGTYSQPVDIGLGMGLTAGTVVQGNMGSVNRMEFTFIGDVVNLASRLCSVAKSSEILVNEEMAEMVQEYFDMSALPPVEFKGKSGTYTPYLIVGERMVLTKGLVERGFKL
jgi:class 3 adenylate cyclase